MFRQGCPLSPFLYVIAAESLACAVRSSPSIRGFPLPCNGGEAKLSQYAYDTSSIEETFLLLGRYERASRAKVNQGKCHGLLFGPWRNRTSLPVDINWSSAAITVLGTTLSNDGKQDYSPIIKKMGHIVKSWQHRKLSYQGRSLIINTLVASTLWYLVSTCYIERESRYNQY